MILHPWLNPRRSRTHSEHFTLREIAGQRMSTETRLPCDLGTGYWPSIVVSASLVDYWQKRQFPDISINERLSGEHLQADSELVGFACRSS
jgi:hypothetical protein